jgi:hypothetical protein
MNKLKLKVKARTKIVVMTKWLLKRLLKKLKFAVQGKWKCEKRGFHKETIGQL